MKILRQIRFLCGSILIFLMCIYIIWWGFDVYVHHRIEKDLQSFSLTLDSIDAIQPTLNGVFITGVKASNTKKTHRFHIPTIFLTFSFQSIFRATYQSMEIKDATLECNSAVFLGGIEKFFLRHAQVLPDKKFNVDQHHVLKNACVRLYNTDNLSNADASSLSMEIPFDGLIKLHKGNLFPHIEGKFNIKSRRLTTNGEILFNTQNASLMTLSLPKGTVILRHINVSPLFSIDPLSSFFTLMTQNRESSSHYALYGKSMHVVFSSPSQCVHALKNDQQFLFRHLTIQGENFYLQHYTPHDQESTHSHQRALHTPISFQSQINLFETFCTQCPSLQTVDKHPSLKNTLGYATLSCADQKAELNLQSSEKGVEIILGKWTFPMTSFEPFLRTLYPLGQHKLDGSITVQGDYTFLDFPMDLAATSEDHDTLIHQSRLNRSFYRNAVRSIIAPLLRGDSLFKRGKGQVTFHVDNMHLLVNAPNKPENPEKPSPLFHMKELSGDATFTLPHWKTPRPQSFSIKTLYCPLISEESFHDVHVKWSWDDDLILHHVDGKGLGGDLRFHDFHVTPHTQKISFDCSAKNIRLHDILKQMRVKNLEGQGMMEGKAHFSFLKDVGIKIQDAQFFSTGTEGTLSYQGPEDIDNTNQTPKEHSVNPLSEPTLFTMLSLSLAQKNDRTHIVLDILGRNPHFQKGHPHRFSIEAVAK